MQARIIKKFGVWEDEIQELINNISTQTTIAKEDLTEWFYNDGALVFVSAQGAAHKAATDAKITADGTTPTDVSREDMIQNKIAGFKAILLKLNEKFVKDDATQKTVNALFNDFQVKAITNRDTFFEIQAQITTTLNIFFTVNPPATMMEKATIAKAKVKEMFLAKKEEISASSTLAENEKATYIQQIDAQLQFTDEYAKKMQAVAASVAKQPLSPLALLSMHQPGPGTTTLATDNPATQTLAPQNR